MQTWFRWDVVRTATSSVRINPRLNTSVFEL